MNATDLSILEVLLELLEHDSELLGLHPAVGQQHAPELPLRDPPLHRVMALELPGKGQGGENQEQHKAPKLKAQLRGIKKAP